MRGIDATKLRLAGGRIGFEVATDVTRRQTARAQTGDLQMGEVLADPAALLEDFCHWSAHGGGSRIEDEVFMDAPCQVRHRVEDGASRCERNLGVVSEFIGVWDERRWIGEFVSFQSLAGVI